MSQILCKQCKCNELESDHASKRLCDECVKYNKDNYKQKKNRYQRAQRIYPKMLINLTKNYIIFAEGIKR